MIELIEQLGDANNFSTLDLISGFFQTKMHPDDTFKSGFSTRSGDYEWLRTSFGMRKVPSSFQRLMS
ncbi:Retrovirus-related Pol polyprotein from transposon 17.6, partial [Stegodyphus mimosarum]